MSFRLKGRRRIGDELSRIVRKEIEAARQELAGHQPGTEAIHEARKSLKKIRAVVRLLRPSLGSTYDAENARLREAAHALAALRDADASAETLAALGHRYPAVMTPRVAAAVRVGLRRRKRQARARAGPLISKAISTLDRSCGSTPRVVRKAGRPASVRAGASDAYRRARRQMRGLNAESNDQDFHAWRRRVKDHWYHVRLFEGLHPNARARARRLKQLERWLGDDHNVSLLRTTILGAPDRFGSARTTALVLGCITKYQASIRRRALASGRRLFDAKAKAFRQSLDSWRSTRR